MTPDFQPISFSSNALEQARNILQQSGQRYSTATLVELARELSSQPGGTVSSDGRSGSIRFNPQPIPVDIYDDNPFAPAPRDMESIKKEMKQRHLTRSERDALHNPETDWVQTPRGEVCKNACSLEVEDIITKYKD